MYLVLGLLRRNTGFIKSNNSRLAKPVGLESRAACIHMHHTGWWYLCRLAHPEKSTDHVDPLLCMQPTEFLGGWIHGWEGPGKDVNPINENFREELYPSLVLENSRACLLGTDWKDEKKQSQPPGPLFRVCLFMHHRSVFIYFKRYILSLVILSPLLHGVIRTLMCFSMQKWIMIFFDDPID